MKETTTLELEQLRQHLEYRNDKTLRNLNPFFVVKLFELQLPISPSVIIKQAFPEAEPEKAQLFERSQKDFGDNVINFFSQLEKTSQEKQLKVTYEFLEALEPIIKLEKSKIWEYVPDESSFDELYDFIGSGFTYIIVEDNKRQCFTIHCGYID